MRITSEKVLRVVAGGSPPAIEPPARVALDWLCQDAVTAFVDAPSDELTSLAAAVATPLAIGTDRERHDARVRLAARMIATGRVQMQALELSLARALEHRDEAGVVMLNRVLDGVSRRTSRWLEEHRASTSSAPRSVAMAVTITGER